MTTRYLSASGTAALMTYGLLFLMQALISLQPSAETDKVSGIGVDWRNVLIKKDPPSPPQPRIRPEDLTHAPLPPGRIADDGPGVAVGVAYNPAPPEAGISVPTGLPILDGPLVSLVKVQPSYPAVALGKGLEGYVIVQFDVLPDGHTANFSIVESTDRAFENASIQAAQRFRFRPAVVDGVPQVSKGIRNLFRFRIDD